MMWTVHRNLMSSGKSKFADCAEVVLGGGIYAGVDCCGLGGECWVGLFLL